MPTPASLPDGARNVTILFLTLMLFWVMLVDTFAADSTLIGALVSPGVALLYRDGLSFFTEFRANPNAVIAGVR